MGSCCGRVFPDPDGSWCPGEAVWHRAPASMEMSHPRASEGVCWAVTGLSTCPTSCNHMAPSPSPSVKWAEMALGTLAYGVTQPSDLSCPGTGPHAQEDQAEAQESWDPQGYTSRWGACP